jgi:uncharacterized repeat protein (TIGR01451 family)
MSEILSVPEDSARAEAVLTRAGLPSERDIMIRRLELALALIFAVGLPTSASAVSLNETFMNSTAPGWNLVGTAVLTSGGVDPAGAGWLRLTTNAGNQAGTAIYNTAFSSAAGVQVIFTYATYSFVNAPGDGISFYLIDGATAVPTIGAYGGPLGYSRITTTTPQVPGVTNGYVGIGLDEYGNFGTLQSGGCSYVPCSLGLSGVTIRGSGSLTTGFNYYTQAAATIPTGSRASAKKVRITVTPAPTVNATVEIDSGSGFVTVINNFNISGIAGQAAIPATFKMGFAAGTGWATDFHEIRGFTTTNADPGPADLTITKSHSGNFVQGDTGKTYTITASNPGPGATAGTVTVTDTLPAGLTPTAPNGVVDGWSCAIGGQTLTCTRSDVLASGASYPAIALAVNVASNAAATLINTASVSGGGEINTANDTAVDPTTVNTVNPVNAPAIPAVSEWALIALASMLALLGAMRIRA